MSADFSSTSCRQKTAFTLVELSIVLVILGLLVGGILVGQSLIRDAAIRSIMTQDQRYVTATQSFRDKYFGLPGDLNNATAWWGTATNCPGTSAQPSTTAATCNGDGNQKIDASATSNERFRFWQHLANAGLIEGNYSGVDGGSNGVTAIAANSPTGKLGQNTVFMVTNSGTISGDSSRFDGYYDNTLQFGGVLANADDYGSVLTPVDAYNVDSKMDDGMPATGKIVARASVSWASPQTCTTATDNTTLTAKYILTSTTPSCALIFRQAF